MKNTRPPAHRVGVLHELHLVPARRLLPHCPAVEHHHVAEAGLLRSVHIALSMPITVSMHSMRMHSALSMHSTCKERKERLSLTLKQLAPWMGPLMEPMPYATAR